MTNECWVIVYYGDSLVQNYARQSEFLPMYPDEISDTQSSIWNKHQIYGRSSPIAAYIGTDARNVSFSMKLHREMSDNIEDILKLLRKALYPRYNSVGLVPPRVRFVFGEFVVDGTLDSLSYSWEKPIVDKKYHVCTVAVTVTGYPSQLMSYDNLGSSSNPDNYSTAY